MTLKLTLFFTILFTCTVAISANSAHSHDSNAASHYLGNEGIMVENAGVKVLFDPFFHNSYNNYTLVPEDIRKAIFSNSAPYDNITALFISHGHGDHFDKTDVMNYMVLNKTVQLVAPSQVVKTLEALKGFEQIKDRITAISLTKGQPAITLNVKDIEVQAVRIPHSGWPQRADISNIVYRIKLNKETVFMHMGDAASMQSLFDEHKDFWPSQQTDVAFPPYWFSLSPEGRHIQSKVINAKKTIAIHVPTKVPASLKSTGDDYLSKPGEIREVKLKK